MNIYSSIEDAPVALPRNTIICSRYQDAASRIPSGSVDCVIIDPPYTDGKIDALPNHKIQTQIDIDHVINEAFRILKPNGFFVFFGQMPTMVAWLNAAQKVFKYREHITWVKRNVTSPYLPIQRSKEDFFIYAKGKPKFHETKAKYEDLKTPALHVGLYELSTTKSMFSDLYRRVKDNKYNDLYYQGVGVDNSLSTLPEAEGQTEEGFLGEVERDFDDLDKAQALQISRGDHVDKTLRYTSKEREFDELDKNNKIEISHGNANDQWLKKKLPNAAREKAKNDFDELDKSQKDNRELSDKRNNALMQNAFQKTLEKRLAENDFDNSAKTQKLDTVGCQDPASNDAIFTKGRNLKLAHRYKSKQWCNLTNTWSFLPTPKDIAADLFFANAIDTVWTYLTQNQTKMGKNGENWKHPTVKPLLLFQRLIDLLTPKPTPEYTPLIVDFFVGSGTTTLAAQSLGRDYIGIELQPEYFDIAVNRHKLDMQGAKPQSPKQSKTEKPAKEQGSLF